MFDKISIRATIDTEDIGTIVLKNYLEECSEGDEVYYKSTAYANFDGVWIEIRGDTLRCRCSINKLYAKARTGRLDNSRPMTFAMAVRTINELLLRLCVRAENAIVTYYEVGITMKLSKPPQEYISLIDIVSKKVLWNDANYPQDRQRTSEKSKYIRKVMKIYDKTFEATEKRRKVEHNVLRIETIYKHQNVPLVELMDNIFLHKLGKTFYDDWMNAKFYRNLVAKSGVRLSQLEKAREINLIGVTRYKQKYKALWKEGRVTKKQWETIRNFANNWNNEKENYDEEISDLEKEYKNKLLSNYQLSSFTPFKKSI